MALSSNILAYWKLDEASGNAADATGNGNTLTNNNTVSFGAGKLNNCADFGASNTNKNFSNTTNMSLAVDAARSYSMWVNITTAPTSGNYFDLMGQGYSANDVFYQIEYGHNGTNLQLRVGRARNGVDDPTMTYVVTLTPGTWYHIVYTNDGSYGQVLYVNGAQVANNTAISGNGSGGGTFDGTVFSRALFAVARVTQGKQDETGIWSRALTKDEVAQLYNAGRVLPYPFTVDILTSIVAAFMMNSNSNDSLGVQNGVDTSVTYSAGKISNAGVYGSGSKTDVAYANFDVERTQGFTVSLWINVTALAGNQFLFSHQDDGTGTPGTDYRGYSMYLLASGAIRTDMYTSVTPNVNISADTPAVISTNTWYHVVLVYDGSSSGSGIKVYVNNVAQTMTPSSSGTLTTIKQTNPFTIGNRKVAFNLSGKVDILAFWTRQLTTAEISQLYNAGAAVEYPFAAAAAGYINQMLLMGVG